MDAIPTTMGRIMKNALIRYGRRNSISGGMAVRILILLLVSPISVRRVFPDDHAPRTGVIATKKNIPRWRPRQPHTVRTPHRPAHPKWSKCLAPTLARAGGRPIADPRRTPSKCYFCGKVQQIGVRPKCPSAYASKYTITGRATTA